MDDGLKSARFERVVAFCCSPFREGLQTPSLYVILDRSATPFASKPPRAAQTRGICARVPAVGKYCVDGAICACGIAQIWLARGSHLRNNRNGVTAKGHV